MIGILLPNLAEGTDTSYALPASVVKKVVTDFKKHGQVQYAWLGAKLEPETTTPKVLLVRENSPAIKAGLKAGDVIRKIGDREISEYQDVVDAFYYLTTGVLTEMEILRGMDILKLEFLPLTKPLIPKPPVIPPEGK